MRQALWVDQLGQDLRYALTLLTRDRAFTLVAALALALGIAATTSLITVVNAFPGWRSIMFGTLILARLLVPGREARR